MKYFSVVPYNRWQLSICQLNGHRARFTAHQNVYCSPFILKNNARCKQRRQKTSSLFGREFPFLDYAVHPRHIPHPSLCSGRRNPWDFPFAWSFVILLRFLGRERRSLVKSQEEGSWKSSSKWHWLLLNVHPLRPGWMGLRLVNLRRRRGGIETLPRFRFMRKPENKVNECTQWNVKSRSLG